MPLYRQSGKWMVIWDDRILEILAKEGPKAPSKIANRGYIHVGPSHISKRLSKLADHGLVDPAGNGVYMITREGRLYLVGGYNADTDTRIKQEEGEGVRPLDWTQIYLSELREAISSHIPAPQDVESQG